MPEQYKPKTFKQLSTSGAIQRYVPVSAVIISVNDSSLAKPKSASLIVLWSAVKIKFSVKRKGNKVVKLLLKPRFLKKWLHLIYVDITLEIVLKITSAKMLARI